MKLKKRVRTIVLIILGILIISITGYTGYKAYRTFKKEDVSVEIAKSEIKDFEYKIYESDTAYYKNLFYELEKVLNKTDINYEEYAKLIASMTVYDFYNLKEKVSKNDVGGLEFILEAYKENFILEAENTIYKYIENNISGKREQELPEVSSVEVIDTKSNTYAYEDYNDDSAYIIKLKIEYKKDLNYPKEVTVKLLHVDKKLEVFYLA